MDGQTVILDQRESRYLTINGAGSLILELLQQDRTREELIQSVLAAYEVGVDTATRDVDAFIAQLGEKGLLAAEVGSDA